MAVFNSLGSNYSLGFCLKAFWLFFSKPETKAAKNKIKSRLKGIKKGRIEFFYKGRHAISGALLAHGIKPGDKVGLQAFTCWAVEESIHSIKAEPVFIDTASRELNFSVSTLKRVHKKHKDLKALIVQHTLGYRADMDQITDYCKEHKIVVIEDLAHSADFRIVSKADAVVFSFGRDKIIDAITGGAFISKEKLTTLIKPSRVKPQDLLYPWLTKKIRSTYSFGIGKVLHAVLKKTHVLTSPIYNSAPDMTALPAKYFKLVYHAVKEVPDNIARRREIAEVYQEILDEKLLLPIDIAQSTCLRYPILVANRDQVIQKAKQKHVYISDTWYKEPVEKGSLKVKSTYRKKSCPNAEKLSRTILNLPTHRGVSRRRAKKIAELINLTALPA